MENKGKICTACFQFKPLSEYYKNGKYGLHTSCKICISAKCKKYYEINKERINRRNRKYALAHKTQLREYSKKYNHDNYQIIRVRQAEKRDRIYFAYNRNRVLERDSFKCQVCGTEKKILIHHKDGLGRSVKNPNNELNNLITVCRKCHINIHREDLLNGRTDISSTAR